MSKFINFFLGAVAVAPLAHLAADNDQPVTKPYSASYSNDSTPLFFPVQQEVVVESHHTSSSPVETAINPFTGKVRGNRVRVRLGADLESRILKELDKNELVKVVAERGDFYAVEGLDDMKAYVFRSFVLDNTIEGNRVNIRLLPDLEAPVLGHLNSGDKINGSICPDNSKWLEIAVPETVHFYIAKEFIENIGGPEVKMQITKRKTTVNQMLENAAFLSKAELRKPFAEMDIERIQHTYKKIISDYTDFPEVVDAARDALSALQEAYVQKRISFLEAKTSNEESSASVLREELVSLDASEALNEARPTDKMLLWEPIEEALYLNWAAIHEDRSIQEYYDEQKAIATTISGILETYSLPVKNRPGDFVLKDSGRDLPVAYIYSTKVNLQDMVGKRVKLRGIERPNNNFAFPAYFVVAEE